MTHCIRRDRPQERRQRYAAYQSRKANRRMKRILMQSARSSDWAYLAVTDHPTKTNAEWLLEMREHREYLHQQLTAAEKDWQKKSCNSWRIGIEQSSTQNFILLLRREIESFEASIAEMEARLEQ